MKLLNIACGNRTHKDWVNIDFHKSSKDVIPINALKMLPFKNNSFDYVYSGHFFEHISKKDANNLLKEIYRVLKKDGILRIVVPDLENICKEYLKILSGVNKGKDIRKYGWITIELLDQMIRFESGGEMKKFYKNKNIMKDKTLRNYIKKRVGEDIYLYSKRNASFKEKLKKSIYIKLKN